MIETTQIKENIKLLTNESDEIVELFTKRSILFLEEYVELTEEHNELIEEYTVFKLTEYKYGMLEKENMAGLEYSYRKITMPLSLKVLCARYGIPTEESQVKNPLKKDGVSYAW